WKIKRLYTAHMKMLSTYLSLITFIAIGIVLAFWDAPLLYLTEMLSGMNFMSYVIYVLLLVSAVVFMPLTIMPIIPFAATLFGPFITVMLSIIGWTIGAVIAFLISRYAARPVLARFVSFEKLDAVTESMPHNAHFFIIILMRLSMPVDIVSYALGLSKNIKLFEYVLATAIGVSWFSFAFAYLGDALLTGNMLLIIKVAGASTLVFLGGWYLLNKALK
ncbi:MAG: VTT domain-containing protein, partial [Candidatus Paceibacterota bacterium]